MEFDESVAIRSPPAAVAWDKRSRGTNCVQHRRRRRLSSWRFLCAASFAAFSPPAVVAAVNATSNPLSPGVLQARIIGGSVVMKGRFDHTVSLTKFGAHYCGGTVISSDTIMTAAHCQAADGVVVGNFAKRTGGKEYMIKQKVVHEKYSLSGYRNDIMLIKVAGTITVPPIEVNKKPSIPVNGYPLTVTGWGVTNTKSGESSNYLREVEVLALSQYECARAYENGKIKSEMMCAARWGKDACQGDSGGPIIVEGRSANKDVQVGIVSWGYGCADSEYPGVYTRCSYMYSWIREKVCMISDDPSRDYKCPARRERFTYVASLRRNGRHYCSASLISTDMLITSAQCSAADQVVLGGDTFYIADKIRHPKYNSSKKRNDLLLIKIRGQSENPVVKVNGNRYQPAKGSPLLSLGEGVKDASTGEYVDGLQQIEMKYVTKSKCMSAYGSRITDSMLCSSDPKADACHSDIGGPVIIQGTTPGTDFLVGINSWVQGCANPKYPQVNYRASTHYNWLRNKVCEGSNLPDWSFYCGVHFSRFPYVVSLTDEKGKHMCSGSLIAPKIVLTSAQCSSAAGVTIEEEFGIDQKIAHPKFDEKENQKDIMVIKLDGKSQREPLELNNDSWYPLNGYPIVAVGNGKMHAKSDVFFDGIQEVQKTTISNGYCADIYGKNAISEDQLCAKEPGYGFCMGDLGGPVLLKGKTAKSDKQVGIFSYEQGCASSTYPIITSRISALYPWIESTVCSMSKVAPSGYNCKEQELASTAVEDKEPEPVPTPSPTKKSEGRSNNKITVCVNFDRFAEDVTWTLESVDGEEFGQGGPWSDDEYKFKKNCTTVEVKPAVSYRFTISDSFGDGMMYEKMGSYELCWGTGPCDPQSLILSGTGGFNDSAEEIFDSDGKAMKSRYIEIKIKFDDNAKDIGWRVDFKPPSGETVLIKKKIPGKAYDDSYNGKTISEKINLPTKTGKFRVIIQDKYGDGICCTSGRGFYRVFLYDGSNEDGILVGKNDDDFAKRGVHTFDA